MNHDNDQTPIIKITCHACGHFMTVLDNGWSAIMCQRCHVDVAHPSEPESKGKPMDLHTLIRVHGLEFVAARMGCAAGSLRNKRSGFTTITLDELHRLSESFGAFDACATIKRIGSKRQRFTPIEKGVRHGN